MSMVSSYAARFGSRPDSARIPVLFLTARSDEVDRVLGLEIGGDDYMTKPFSPRELIARVKAHLRREEMDAEPPSVGIGPFRLDRTARRVYLEEREISLTSTEFNLLEYFLTHPGRAYSRDQLLEAVWGEQRYVTPRTVDVHVRRLREQIEDQPDAPRYLTTVRGFGYRFEEASMTGRIFLKLIVGRVQSAPSGAGHGGLFRHQRRAGKLRSKPDSATHR